MGFFSKLGKGLLITGAVAGVSALVVKNKAERAEIQRRKSMICEFDNVITEDVFEAIVYKCAKRIKRISRN